MTDILQAARSYYGLADTHVRKTDIYTNEAGQPMLVFELALSAEDFIAIGARMKNMQEEEKQKEDADKQGYQSLNAMDASSRLDMRAAYDRLSASEKGKFGSFARYVAESSNGILEVQEETAIKRQVAHVDAPEEPEPVSMDAVWLPFNETTLAQIQFASDTRPSAEHGKEYLIQWAMLTDEQKQKSKEKS